MASGAGLDARALSQLLHERLGNLSVARLVLVDLENQLRLGFGAGFGGSSTRGASSSGLPSSLVMISTD